jgi:cold shock protein
MNAVASRSVQEAEMAQGIVVRFDEVKGYGFITPDGGGEDVFVHVNELTPPGTTVSCGTRVEFGVLDGERGLKAYDVQVTDAPSATTAPVARGGNGPGPLPSGALDRSRKATATVPEGSTRSETSPEDTCEIFSESEFTRLATEMLLTADCPDLTVRQVLEIRRSLVRFAAEHGWVD